MTAENKINTFITKTNDSVKKFDTLITDYRSLMEEWKMNLSTVEACDTHYREAKAKIQTNVSKLNRNVFKCVIFGRVSTGKSALINYLLSKRILPSHIGPTTNAFIEIRKSVDGTNYVVFPNSPTKRRDIYCIDVFDELVDSSVLKGSHVDLFYSAEECPLLNDNIIIVDTPGIDRDIEMEVAVKRECEDADVVILLVSSESGLGECEKAFLDQYKQDFSHLKVIIVFNKWDMIDPEMESRWPALQHKCIYEGSCCLSQYLNVPREHCTTGIYFISAEERVNVINEDGTNVLPGSDRNEKFLSDLHLLLKKSSFSRKRSIMDDTYTTLNTLYNTFGEHNRIKLNSEILNRFKEVLKPLNNSQKYFNREIDTIFDSEYDDFLSILLGIVEYLAEEGNEMIESKLNEFVSKTMADTLEKIKKKIRDTVSESSFSDKSYILKLLKKFYFPSSLDLTQEIQMWNMAELRKTLVEINRIIKQSSESSTESAEGWWLWIAGLLHDAASIIDPFVPIIATAVNALACVIDRRHAAPTPAICLTPILAICDTKGGVIAAEPGGSLGDWLSAEYSKRKDHRLKYMEHEDKIKKKWQRMQVVITQSFERFVSNLQKTVDDLMKPLYDNARPIKEELDSLKTLKSSMT